MIVPRRPRVFITTDAVGGVWSYSIALATGLAKIGWRSTLAVLGPAPDNAQWTIAENIPGCDVVLTGQPLEWRLTNAHDLEAVINALVRAARQSGAQSVHLHAPSLAAVAWPIPSIAVAHSCVATWFSAVQGTQPPASLAWHVDATGAGLQTCSMAVAPTQAFANTLQLTYGTKRRIAVIRNGLPAPTTPSSDRTNFVLTAGRLWDLAKNVKLLDEVGGRLDFSIEAAGCFSDPGASDLEFANVKTHGQLSTSALRELMAKAGVFASPAIYEPFGLSVLEAAQLGTPLVLSDIASFRELWSNAAVFLPAQDPAAWERELRSLMTDARRRTELGEAARQRSLIYTDDAMVSATARLHEQLTTCTSSAA